MGKGMKVLAVIASIAAVKGAVWGFNYLAHNTPEAKQSSLAQQYREQLEEWPASDQSEYCALIKTGDGVAAVRAHAETIIHWEAMGNPDHQRTLDNVILAASEFCAERTNAV